MRKPDREAISPIIATIIIIAVTIAIALAVAAWLTGLWTVFTGGPRVSATLLSIVNSTDDKVRATVYLSNQGSASDKLAAATLITQSGTYTNTTFTTTPFTINPGESRTIDISFDVDNAKALVGREVSVELSFTSGTKITLVGIVRSGGGGGGG